MLNEELTTADSNLWTKKKDIEKPYLIVWIIE